MSDRDHNLQLPTSPTHKIYNKDPKMATNDHDTGSKDSEMQKKIACALSKLNKQRIYQFNIAAEGHDSDDLSANRKVREAHNAQEAVEALQKVVIVWK